MNLQTELILASASPRRQSLLKRLGLAFTVQPSDIDETIPAGTEPEAIATDLARQKALSVAQLEAEALILAGDTIVSCGDHILGQPADADDARSMLQQLSGTTHTVCTGLALVHPPSDREVTAFELTKVTLASLSDPEIDAYIASGLPFDKAGAYGIQDRFGALFVTRIDGDYYNVMGLPLHRLYRTLRAHFDDLFTL